MYSIQYFNQANCQAGLIPITYPITCMSLDIATVKKMKCEISVCEIGIFISSAFKY